jgi:hypothetical protein
MKLSQQTVDMMHTYDRQMGGIMKYKWKTVDQKK